LGGVFAMRAAVTGGRAPTRRVRGPLPRAVLRALPLGEVRRSSVGLRHREPVVTDAFTRRVLRAGDIRPVVYAHGVRQRERLEIVLAGDRRPGAVPGLVA
ncbi:hypothetical protein, partial [Kitasatospora sp. NPDC057198]|uniref:hypothetical protein n=1 Tax=Kitasatospora sp. NPDC057198 TaxID=3346046 RepID=UPI00362B1862